MKAHRHDDGTWLVALTPGDRVISSLTKLCREEDVRLARVSGIGGVRKIELGYWDFDQMDFDRRQFPEYHELVSAIGNVSVTEEGDVYVHLHAAFAGREFRLVGGHLFECEVAVAGEFVIEPHRGILPRTRDPDLGVELWNLEKCGAAKDPVVGGPG